MKDRISRSPLWGALSVVLAAGVSLIGGTVGGEEFRVENKIFVGKDKEPRIQSTTIFFHRIVYDYLDDPAEITVFDKDRGRFVLLDPTRRTKTELTTDQLESLTAGLKDWAGSQSDGFLKFLAAPEFDERFDESSGEWAFENPWMSYHLKTTPAGSDQIARQYREFSDWYCQLNTRINPGARPPFARMIVNATLEEHRQLPAEVRLTLKPGGNGFLAKKTTARSEHRVVRRLLESDRDRVAETDQFMAIFEPLSFEKYQSQIQDR